MTASIAGLCSFFIPWFFFGFRGLLLPLGGANLSVSGITAAEYSSWSWWTPPCPQLLLILFGAATMLSLIGWVSKSTAIDAVVALIGAALSILLVRWLWLTRHDFNLLTGFWLTVAAGLLVFMFAVASVVTDRAE